LRLRLDREAAIPPAAFPTRAMDLHSSGKKIATIVSCFLEPSAALLGGWCQFGDLPVGRFGQARQHVFEVGVGVDAALAATLDQRVDHGASPAGFLAADEQPVLGAELGRADGVRSQKSITPVFMLLFGSNS
jgi:hypothetical protein